MSDQNDNCRECFTRLRGCEDRLTRAETIIGDADTGLRGDVRAIISKLGEMERRMYIAIGGFTTMVFIIEKFLK